MGRKPEPRGRAARLVRLLPTGGGRGQAARAPFVLLVVVLLGGGLIGLLVLNSALSEGSFQLDDLRQETKSLTDEEQALQRDIDAYSAPRALQRRARELGMVPGGDPAFLEPDGTVKGSPSPAPAAAAPLVLAPEALTATSGSESAATPSPYSRPPGPAPTPPVAATPGTAATPPAAATPTPTPTPGR
ncbi:septum formation initiator family protein [Streptomyces sp. NPDC048392]|uniref:septum formation initiator family protein n=1 Tax=Streptomyces sp. NPDC048392 TaxID=3365543 RepID=UPI003714ACA3